MRKGLLFVYIVGGIALIGWAQTKIKAGTINLDPLDTLAVAFILLSLMGMIVLYKRSMGEPSNG